MGYVVLGPPSVDSVADEDDRGKDTSIEWLEPANRRPVDCTLDDVWATFLPMYNTSGFTDAKLRVRFDGGGADAV